MNSTFVINGKTKVPFYNIWYKHNDSASSGNEDEFEVKENINHLRFVNIIESMSKEKINSENLEDIIKKQFQQSSFNPIQWLLDLEDTDYEAKKRQPAPWEIKWVFHNITDFKVDENYITIKGNATPVK